MQKTRDLFKKIRDIKRIFHARMHMIKDRNSKNFTETKEVRRGDKNKNNYTKKFFMVRSLATSCEELTH